MRKALRPNTVVSEESLQDPIVAVMIKRLLEVGIGIDSMPWHKREREAEEEIASTKKKRKPTSEATDEEKKWVKTMFMLNMYNELGNLMKCFCTKTEAYNNIETISSEKFAGYFRAELPRPRYWSPLLKDFRAYYEN